MKIDKIKVKRTSFEEFAEDYGLRLRIIERESPLGPMLKVDLVTDMEGRSISAIQGEGLTEDSAIADYRSRIANKTVTIVLSDPWYRAEVHVPFFSEGF